MQPLAYGGQYIVVLGRDGQLWRVYQKNDAAMSWVDWAPLTQACPWKNDTKRTWYAIGFSDRFSSLTSISCVNYSP
jgi:hypothetical protein